MSDLTDYRWLTGDEAAVWLARAAELDERTLAMGALRRDLGPDRARLIAEQVHLRRRAREKFPDAERMFFTRVGLEQATDFWISRYKAQRFPADRPRADLCTGIGGDLMALAAQGFTADCTGCDLDPLTAHFAATNAGAEVRVEDAGDFPLPAEGCWHIDPDRRPGGKRTTHVEGFRPTLEVLIRRLAEQPHGSVKLAPATQAPESWHAAQREWISRGGECRQQIAWFGQLAQHPGRRSATIVTESAVRTVIDTEAAGPSTPAQTGTASGRVGCYLYEPDAAVLAADLAGELARQHALSYVDRQAAYLTGDGLAEDLALDAFAVTDVLPLDRKQLAGLLAARGIGRLEIKKRGCAIDPETLRKQFKLRGEAAATLLVMPIGERVTAVIAQRVHRA